MRDSTLCFLIKGEPPREILLGYKKVRFGKEKYNGFGGKVHDGESILAAAARELYEEAGVEVAPEDLERVAKLRFTFASRPEWDQTVHVFVSRQWRGQPVESEEMRPDWFPAIALPFERMWQDDVHWLPRVLAGERVEADFAFLQDGETLGEFEVRATDGLAG